MTYKKRWLLLIPAFWASGFDIAISIIQQPKEYWAGDLLASNEGNPVGKFMMMKHVSGIFVVSFSWLVVITCLGYYLPNKLSRIFLVFVLIAHSYGAATWINRAYGFWVEILFFIFNAFLFFWMDELAGITNLKSPFTNHKS